MACIKQGLICNHCTDKHCDDIGTDAEPLELECQSCDGRGCDECNDGQIRIHGCPQKYCKEIIPVIGLIDLFEKGLPPVAGGVLDQSAWFIEAARVLRIEESLARNEATK